MSGVNPRTYPTASLRMAWVPEAQDCRTRQLHTDWTARSPLYYWSGRYHV